MTEHEHLMYQLLGKISETDSPIIFKGALITKLVLLENGYIALNRQTSDIDANWIDSPPTMEKLVDIIQQSLDTMSQKFYAVSVRVPPTNGIIGLKSRDRRASLSANLVKEHPGTGKERRFSESNQSSR